MTGVQTCALPIFNIGQYFLNSLIVTVISTVISVFVVSLAAYVSARISFKGQNLVTLMLASTLFIPSISISFPSSVSYTHLGDSPCCPTTIHSAASSPAPWVTDSTARRVGQDVYKRQVREYLDSKAAPAPKPKRTAKAATPKAPICEPKPCLLYTSRCV